MPAPAKQEARLLNHQADVVAVAIVSSRVREVCAFIVTLMIDMSIALVVVEAGMHLMAFAIKVAVNLLALFLEMLRFNVFAISCGAYSLVLKALLDAISLIVQMPFDVVSLIVVMLTVITVVASVSHGNAGREHHKKNQYGRNYFFHGLVLSLCLQRECLCLLRRIKADKVYFWCAD